MKSFKYIVLLTLAITVVSCTITEITSPKLEVTIVSPPVNPETAQAILLVDQKFVYEARQRGADTTSYEWLQDGVVISNSLISDSSTFTTSGQHVARFSAQNESYESYAEILINVVNKAATFEELILEENSYWRGDDSSGVVSTFNSGGIDFLNNSYTDTTEYYNFGYSNITDSTHKDFDSYGAYIRVPNQNKFGMARMDSVQTEIKIQFDSTYVPGSISIANNPSVIKLARGSVDQELMFGSGDYYDLEIRGIKADGSLTEQFTSTRLIEGTTYTINYIKDWEPVNLTSLGEVNGLQFTINTTAKDPETGILYIEKRFNIDNLILVDDASNFTTP